MHGKVVIVTGAGSGVGRATALALARAGAGVVVNARSSEKLDALVNEISAGGGRAVAFAGDVAEEETAIGLVETAEKAFGGLDGAFNNAGDAGEMGPITGLSLKGWRRTVAVNLDGIFLGLKHQAPAMVRRGGGAIVCTSSANGLRFGMPGMAAYGAAKAGIMGLVNAAAIEFGPLGIRINTIVPGGVDTPPNKALPPDMRTRMEGMHALKRFAQPEELATAAMFLLSGEAGFITGSSVFVDGGLTVSRL